jgi:hypothetical protein
LIVDVPKQLHGPFPGLTSAGAPARHNTGDNLADETIRSAAELPRSIAAWSYPVIAVRNWKGEKTPITVIAHLNLAICPVLIFRHTAIESKQLGSLDGFGSADHESALKVILSRSSNKDIKKEA